TTITAWNAGEDTIELSGTPVGPFEFSNRTDSNTVLRPGGVARWTYSGKVIGDPARSAPYFLRQPRNGDSYVWPYADDSNVRPPAKGASYLMFQSLPSGFGLQGQPFERPASVNVRFRVAGSGENGWMVATRELSSRTNDQARGEIRRPVVVVPRVDVKLDP